MKGELHSGQYKLKISSPVGKTSRDIRNHYSEEQGSHLCGGHSLDLLPVPPGTENFVRDGGTCASVLQVPSMGPDTQWGVPCMLVDECQTCEFIPCSTLNS